MQQHNLKQGTPEWFAHRRDHFNASDAPAMLGCSPYKTRTQLLREMKTGLTAEVGADTQRLFDVGHRAEALARPIAEAIVGEELYPVVGSMGKLSASFDGLTLLEDVAFEHKSLNDDIRAVLASDGETHGSHLPKHYRVQMEQQLMVSGAEKVLFMATKWKDAECIERRWCWYSPDRALGAEIIAGWKQFEEDLQAFDAPTTEAPAPVGRAPETLPALRIEITGAVTASNLAEFKEMALGAIRSVNRELTDDQHFADAEKAVKWCGEVEDRIKAAKQHALSQTASIDELFRTLDDLSAEARAVRLDLEKLVKARKDAIRGDIVASGVSAFGEHFRALNTRLGATWMPAMSPDFGGRIKGLKSVDSIRDAVATELARAKIEASAIADRIHANRESLKTAESDRIALFPDFVHVCTKPAEDFANLVAARVAADERRREAEREAEEARQRAQAAAPAPTPAPATVHAQAPATVVPLRPSAASPTLKLGEIAARLGFALPADVLRQLGFDGVRDRGAVLYQEADFPRICDALIARITQAREQRQAA